MSNQMTVLRVEPIKDAKNQTEGYKVFDTTTGKVFDAPAAGLRHIMMHLAFQNGQYVYRYGKKWRRAAADAKIFKTYAVVATPIVKPVKKGKNIQAPIVEAVAPELVPATEAEVVA